MEHSLDMCTRAASRWEGVGPGEGICLGGGEASEKVCASWIRWRG